MNKISKREMKNIKKRKQQREIMNKRKTMTTKTSTTRETKMIDKQTSRYASILFEHFLDFYTLAYSLSKETYKHPTVQQQAQFIRDAYIDDFLPEDIKRYVLSIDIAQRSLIKEFLIPSEVTEVAQRFILKYAANYLEQNPPFDELPPAEQRSRLEKNINAKQTIARIRSEYEFLKSFLSI